jgi:hypothetical protein
MWFSTPCWTLANQRLRKGSTGDSEWRQDIGGDASHPAGLRSRMGGRPAAGADIRSAMIHSRTSLPSQYFIGSFQEVFGWRADNI